MNKERILIETVFLVMAALKEQKNLKPFSTQQTIRKLLLIKFNYKLALTVLHSVLETTSIR